MSRPVLSAPSERLPMEVRTELRAAKEAVWRANRLLAKAGFDRRYGVLIADAPHAGLFVEPVAGIEEVA